MVDENFLSQLYTEISIPVMSLMRIKKYDSIEKMKSIIAIDSYVSIPVMTIQ